MIELYGEYERYALFTNGVRAVIVDRSLNMVDEVGDLSDLLSVHQWSVDDPDTDDVHFDVAELALDGADVDSAIVASARLYTIPSGVKNEAIKALKWRKKYKRGGTPVGMNTARILANGGQIGIKKVRHIAKYFPRHEVDKRGSGYKPGDDGFPSSGRIAWGLWGGDAGWRWAQQIVERENAKTASAFEDDVHRSYDADVSYFDVARSFDGLDNAPEFVARVRLDGTGIDRLYVIDDTGRTQVWDGSGWDDMGRGDSDIFGYDRSLDDYDDEVEKRHVVVDPQSALILSAHMQERPFHGVNVEDLDAREAELVAAAIDEIDWQLVDSAIVAAGEEPLSGPSGGVDGQYTPEERAENAKRQIRDKTGKFAKMGSKVTIDGDSGKVGNITRLNPAKGTVTVSMPDGSTQEVDARRTQAYAPPLQERPDDAQTQMQPDNSQMPLDTSGILAKPRAPIDRPNVVVPGGLPALRPGDFQQIINDFPAWVMDQRRRASEIAQQTEPQPTAAPGTQPTRTAGDTAPAHEKSDYIKGVEKETGDSLYTDSAYSHPLLQNFFKKKSNRAKYSPITSSGDLVEVENKKSEEKKEPVDAGEPLTPDTSDVQPMYMALVSPDDPSAVMDLISIVPASTTSTSPITFKRVDGEWVRDDQILADLKSATPPPVVALTDEAYTDVLSQVDETLMTASGFVANESAYSGLFASVVSAEPRPLIAVGEGGLDRNRGNAEKLRRYWLYGRGALKIRWNTPGDWTRCYRHLSKYMGPRAKGYCSLRHKEATGVWPGSKFNVGKRNIRGSIESRYQIATEEQLVLSTYARAAIADAKTRVMIASGGGGIAETLYGSRFTIPLVIPEDAETGDGRVFKKGAITTRELPLPLLWQIKTSDGHDGSVVVGRIDTMERIDNGIGNAHGVFDTGPYGREAERMVRNGFINGVSADLDKFEASEEEYGSDDDDDKYGKKPSIKDKKNIGNSKITVEKARVMAVTIVPKPAFEECKIYAVDDTTDTSSQEAEMAVAPNGVYIEDIDLLDAEALVACGMVADAIPVVPPDDWFGNPQLSGPTPLTVDDTGRVFGHIAAWSVDHIGMAAGTKPPKSKSKYAYFHTGAVRTSTGRDVPVGQLTLSGGHASLNANAIEAARHYDDTGSAVADVCAGEDAYGIWVSGALRPNASPEQVRALRASAPSGDWRPINGTLELVAVCQVNVPGFPIARARVASGQVYALVAAGAMTLAKMKTDPFRDISQRLEKLEERAGMSTLDQIRAIKASATGAPVASADLSAKAEALSMKVKADAPYESLAYVSVKTREKLAEEGKALPDGSYPIRNVADLKNAIQAYGRSKPSDRAKVRRHIMKRAGSLKRGDLIPEGWKTAGLIDDDVVSDIRSRATLAVQAATAAVDADNSAELAMVKCPECGEMMQEGSACECGYGIVAALKARVEAAKLELSSTNVWDTKNPNKKSKPLTQAQKAAAKRSAKKAGRRYPNMVDNINAAKKDGK